MGYINISKSYKGDNKFNWIASVPAASFEKVNNTEADILITERNYYYCSKADRIRYETMKVDRASYSKMYDVYINIKGVYCYVSIAHNDNLNEIIERKVNQFKQLKKENVNNWLNELIKKGR